MWLSCRFDKSNYFPWWHQQRRQWLVIWFDMWHNDWVCIFGCHSVNHRPICRSSWLSDFNADLFFTLYDAMLLSWAVIWVKFWVRKLYTWQTHIRDKGMSWVESLCIVTVALFSLVLFLRWCISILPSLPKGGTEIAQRELAFFNQEKWADYWRAVGRKPEEVIYNPSRGWTCPLCDCLLKHGSYVCATAPPWIVSAVWPWM